MLDIYQDILRNLAELRPIIQAIGRQDPDLARQMRRAASGIALGVAEGQYSRKGNRPARFHEALASARETQACVEVAVALGYVKAPDPETMDRLDKVIRTLVRLVDATQ